MSTLEERIRATTEIGIKEKKIIENEKSFLNDVFEQACGKRTGEMITSRTGEEFYESKLENGIFVYIKEDGNNGFEKMIISPTQRKDFRTKGSAYIYAHSYTERDSDKSLVDVFYRMEDGLGQNILDVGLCENNIYYNDNQTILTKGNSTTIIDYIREMPEGSLEFELLRNDLNKIFEGTDREVKTYTDEEIAIMNLERENKEIKVGQQRSSARVREEVRGLEQENEDLKTENEDLKTENKVLEKVKASLQIENQELTKENSEQEQKIVKLQKMLSKTLEFANKVRESTVGKIFFKKPLKELNLDGNALPEGEER